MHPTSQGRQIERLSVSNLATHSTVLGEVEAIDGAGSSCPRLEAPQASAGVGRGHSRHRQRGEGPLLGQLLGGARHGCKPGAQVGPHQVEEALQGRDDLQAVVEAGQAAEGGGVVCKAVCSHELGQVGSGQACPPSAAAGVSMRSKEGMICRQHRGCSGR